MTEAYLHFLWKLKRLPFHLMKTTSGESIDILQHGIHNLSESGPDFSNARIYFDKMEWAGQIELHIKSSDWLLHKHQHDPAYNNVILHVVYEHDREIYINGRILPTIELKPFIDEEHYQQWKTFEQALKAIPCEDSLLDLDPIFMKVMMHRAVNDRFHRKVGQLLYEAHHTDDASILYKLIARAFGSKINALPFEVLTNELPLAIVKRLNRTMKQQLVLQTSGLFANIESEQELKRLKISTMSTAVWKRKGLRPTSLPEKRIFQFATFVMKCDFDLLSTYLSPKEAYLYLEKVLLDEGNYLEISEQILHQLLINALLPYFWLISERDENEKLQEVIIEILHEIPPEINYITKKWKKVGIHPKSAYESQALIELYNEYCSKKKCLHCQVGVKILKGN